MSALPTKERLAQRLHSIGLFDLEKRARGGEFSDFESPHACPIVLLVGLLQEIARTTGNLSMAKMAHDLSVDLMNGKYDDAKEEAEAWFEREEKYLFEKG